MGLEVLVFQLSLLLSRPLLPLPAALVSLFLHNRNPKLLLANGTVQKNYTSQPPLQLCVTM